MKFLHESFHLCSTVTKHEKIKVIRRHIDQGQKGFHKIMRCRCSVGTLAGVDPVVVHVDRLGQERDGRLEVFHADGAEDAPRVLALVQLDLARLLVVAERAVKLGVERLDVPALRRRLALALLLAHVSQTARFFFFSNRRNQNGDSVDRNFRVRSRKMA